MCYVFNNPNHLKHQLLYMKIGNNVTIVSKNDYTGLHFLVVKINNILPQ